MGDRGREGRVGQTKKGFSPFLKARVIVVYSGRHIKHVSAGGKSTNTELGSPTELKRKRMKGK